MVGLIRHANLTTPRARRRLTPGRQPHWQALVRGRAHLGWQRWPGERTGRWLLRRYLRRNKYRVIELGPADDAMPADGVRVLNFSQAEAMARAMLDTAPATVHRLTVAQAMARYIEFKQGRGQPVGDVMSRSTVHILPALGDYLVSELTAEQLRRWLAVMAAQPPQARPKAGKPQYQPAAATDDAIRARRASANRVLTMLKAALNHAFDEGHVANRDAWGRKLKPFHNVEVARVHYLDHAQARRLVNAAYGDFRPLVRAALETGCRYGELARLEIADFNADAGTVTIRKSKSSKPRHVILTPEGADFFREHCAGRARGALMFTHDDDTPWRMSEQGRPMRTACERARITPAVGFHALRHTWASLATMAGVPLLVVARNMGHADTRMVEKHYGHLAPSFITEAIHAGAPRYGIKAGNKRVVPFKK
jgi:integrase